MVTHTTYHTVAAPDGIRNDARPTYTAQDVRSSQPGLSTPIRGRVYDTAATPGSARARPSPKDIRPLERGRPGEDPFVSEKGLSATASEFQPRVPPPKPTFAAADQAFLHHKLAQLTQTNKIGTFTTESGTTRYLEARSSIGSASVGYTIEVMIQVAQFKWKRTITYHLVEVANVCYIRFPDIVDAVECNCFLNANHHLRSRYIPADRFGQVATPDLRGYSSYEGQVLLKAIKPNDADSQEFEARLRDRLAQQGPLVAWHRLSPENATEVALLVEYYNISEGVYAVKDMNGTYDPFMGTVVSVAHFHPDVSPDAVDFSHWDTGRTNGFDPSYGEAGPQYPTRGASMTTIPDGNTPPKWKEPVHTPSRSSQKLKTPRSRASDRSRQHQAPWRQFPHTPLHNQFDSPCTPMIGPPGMPLTPFPPAMAMDPYGHFGAVPVQTPDSVGFGSNGWVHGDSPVLIFDRYASFDRYFRFDPYTGSPRQCHAAQMFPPKTQEKRNEDNAPHNHVHVKVIEAGLDVRTTIMLRNIPNKIDQPELKEIIDKHSLGKYDFSYLRIDFTNHCNVGYAFINFIDPLEIIPFFNAVAGKKWDRYQSEKVAEVSYATIQGRDCLIQKFRNSSVMLEPPHYRPKLWFTVEDGAELAGKEEVFPVADNSSKLNRSCQNAEQQGLFAPNSGPMVRSDQRRGRSLYDRGTPLAVLDERRFDAQSSVHRSGGVYRSGGGRSGRRRYNNNRI